MDSGRTPYCGRHCPPASHPPAIAELPPFGSNRPENCIHAGGCCPGRRNPCPWRTREALPFLAPTGPTTISRDCDARNELPNVWPAEGGSRKAMRGLRRGARTRPRGLGRRAQAAAVRGPSCHGSGSDGCRAPRHPDTGFAARLATPGRLGRRRPGDGRNCLSRSARSRSPARVRRGRRRRPFAGAMVATSQSPGGAGFGAPGNAAVDRRHDDRGSACAPSGATYEGPAQRNARCHTSRADAGGGGEGTHNTRHGGDEPRAEFAAFAFAQSAAQ